MNQFSIRIGVTALAAFFITIASSAAAQAPDKQAPSSPEDIQAALSGGVPMGRWNEGSILTPLLTKRIA